MRFVVVGLHAAGRSACGWLRRLAPDAEIIGVDPRPTPPYARPLISYVLSREIEPGLLELADPDFFGRLGVTLAAERAVGLRPDQRLLVLESGREIAFDKLLIATGARPRRVELAGALAGEVKYFRGKADLEALVGAVKPGGTAAVLGGGLVGFKLTMGLLARGMRVVLLVSSPRPLSLNVDEHVGGLIGARLAALDGLSLMTKSTVRSMEPGRARRYALTLESGEVVEADLVAAGKGVVPRTDWLAGTGLVAAGGACGPDEAGEAGGVDAGANLQTALPGVYAAGDAARVWDMVLQTPQVNAIWPMAVEQGRYAAWNMAGPPVAYPGAMAMNSIPIFGTFMISVGAVSPRYTEGCETLIIEPRRDSYLKLVFRDKRLIGAVGLNSPLRLGELAWAVRQGLTRDKVPGSWLANPFGAAPLAGATWGLAGNAHL
jgi:NAD(P)H-nitrite reductase large subunit